MDNLLALTAEIVGAYVSHNGLSASDLPHFIRTTFETLSKFGPRTKPEVIQKPAVSLRASVTPHYVVCLECGVKGKVLKRHLSTNHNLTPADYRAKWKLPTKHPLVAPAYAAKRKEMAIELGLGRPVKNASKNLSTGKSRKSAPSPIGDSETTSGKRRKKKAVDPLAAAHKMLAA